MVELMVYVQKEYEESQEYNEVLNIANMLLNDLNTGEVLDRINIANQPGNQSTIIQNEILNEVKAYGFVSEKKGLFLKYKTPALRPDYFKKIGDTGILLEIERGKTTQNNMDLLDIWKCHICEEANYLFLMVPLELRQNNSGKIEKCFQKVCNRIDSFYISENYINVRATFIFGY